MSETVSVRIDKEQYAKLVDIARKRGVMISWLLSRVLEKYISKQKEAVPNE